MLLHKVEKFLRRHDMAATKFGGLAAQDPRFVLDLRMGRIPRPRTEKRTLDWMADFEAARAVPLPPSLRTATRPHTTSPLETKGFSYAV